MLENEVIETESPTSDAATQDAPTGLEEANEQVEKQEPETVTLTKDELEAQKNAIAAKERKRAERKNERAMQELQARYDAQFEALKATPKDSPDAPRQENYPIYDDFVRATTRFEINNALKSDRESREVDKENQNSEKMTAAHLERESKIRAEIPDYDKALENIADIDFQVNLDIAKLIVSSDISPQLIYYFGKDIDELERIAEMSPLAAAREIGKIEAKILSKPIKTSSAPAPITSLGQGLSSVTKDPTKMTDEEWYASQRKAKARK